MAKVKVNIRKRMIFLYGAFMIIAFALLLRTGYLQIVKGPWLKKEAAQQQTRDSLVSSKRGTIYDRNNKVLAQSASADMVCVVPVDIKNAGNAEEVATKLSEILGLKYEDVYAKTQKNSYYEIVKKKVEKADADKIRELKLAGVRLDSDTKRYYPGGSFASHVIGFTGDDNQGLGGTEMVFDKELKGIAGRIKTAKNADGTNMPYEYEQYLDPIEGNDIVLTIDEAIQYFVEKHLETAYVENQVAQGAAAIVMDPKTGEILAMATEPDFDLNNPMQITDPAVKEELSRLTGDEYKNRLSEELNKIWRNKAVVDTYEPGSTYKAIVASMALEENVVSLNDAFSCNGSITVSGRSIRCHKTTGHGIQSFVEGVRNSCNPVFVAVGERIGPANFIKYHNAFGFTNKTGFELPGEAVGPFHSEAALKPLELATCSFGQSFNVTPLQLLTAVSAIANGGNLMRPHILKQIRDAEGNVIKNVEPEVVRQVISEQTSKTMRSILESVVSDGGGRNAYVKGYRVAGKTGTSEKLPRGSGKYVASFVGFAPADDPKIAVILMLDDPRGPEYYGGMIAAPVVGSIIEDTLRYLGVEPQYKPEEMETKDVIMPEVRGKTVAEAKKELTSLGFKYQIIGEGETVLDQTPKPGIGLSKGSVGILYTQTAESDRKVIVPDVSRCSVLEANQILTNAGLNFKITGPGKTDTQGMTRAIRQEPPPGTEVAAGSIVYVEFRYAGIE